MSFGDYWAGGEIPEKDRRIFFGIIVCFSIGRKKLHVDQFANNVGDKNMGFLDTSGALALRDP